MAPIAAFGLTLACLVAQPARGQTDLPLDSPVQGSASDDEFLRWVNASAISLEDLGSPAGEALLDSMVVGKRFFFIGEMDHYVQINYEARLPLIRALHSRGWRNLGMERGRSDGRRIDRYLETGRIEELDRVKLFRHFDRRNPEHLDGRYGLYQAEYAFAAELLGIGRGEDRLHYFGYDLDMAAGGAFEDVQERLSNYAKSAPVRGFLDSLEVLRKQDLAGQLEAIGPTTADLFAANSELVSALPETVVEEVRADLLWHEAALDFIKVKLKTLAVYQERENWMYRSMDDRVAKADPSDRFILMGHGAHLSKDSSSFVMPRSRMWRSIGTHLAEKHPGEVCSVWIFYDHGEHTNNHTRERARVHSMDGTVNQLLARAELEAFFLPIDGLGHEYLNQDRDFRINAMRVHGNIARQADAIVFFREATVPFE